MASSPPAKSLAPQHSLHGRCAFCCVHSGLSGPSSTRSGRPPRRHSLRSRTFVDALENRLRRAVAFVPALTVRAGDARPSRIDGNHHTTHFQKLPFDCLAKTVEPRAQDGAVEPAFLLHILAGIRNGALGGRRHVLHLQVLDVHAAVLLRERMRRLPVEILSNATNLSV